MAHLLVGSRGRATAASVPATALRVQSSLQGQPIPIGWGRTMLAANLIDDRDFKSYQVNDASASGGGKGGGASTGGKGGGSKTTNYQVAIMMGLCEGPISGVNRAWNGKAWKTLGALNLTVFTGAYDQAAWGYMTSKHPDQALAYRGLAYLAAGPMHLGDSAELPNLSFDVSFTAVGTAVAGSPDVDPSFVLADLLANDNYGAGWQPSWISDFSVYTAYGRAAGLLVSPVLAAQQSVSDFLADLLKGTNAEAFWSQGQLKIVPYGDAALSANGATYTPPDAPVYDLTDDDFIAPDGGGPPIEITRTPAAEAINDVKVEYLDGANTTSPYNPAVAEDQDEASVELYGLVPSDTLTWHYFTNKDGANTAASLYLGRQAIRNTYAFTLKHRRGALLEPMDIVSISETATGLDRQWVRIKDIQENADLSYAITAEEYLAGTGHAPLYGREANDGYLPDYDADPGDINDPIVFEPPDALDPGLKVWAAVSGASTALWGGCEVWAAYNGSSAYARIGDIVGPARMGVLAGSLAAYAGANPDLANTLSVDLSESAGELPSVSAEDADALNSLCYVDHELIGYETAAFTGTDAYNLTHLLRGAYGTARGAHDAGTKFARLDGAIFKFEYDAARVGSTIQLKFLSYNIWRGGQQSLADVDAYSYLLSPVVPTLAAISAACVQHATGIYLDWSVPSVPGIATLKVELSYGDPAFGSPVLVSDGQELAGSFPLRFSGSPETVYVRATAYNLGGVPGNAVTNSFATVKPALNASNVAIDGGAVDPGTLAIEAANDDMAAAIAQGEAALVQARALGLGASPDPGIRALAANAATAAISDAVDMLSQSVARITDALELHRSQAFEAGLSPGNDGIYRIYGVDALRTDMGTQITSVLIQLNSLSAQIDLIAEAADIDLSGALTSITSVSERLDALTASLAEYVLTADFSPVASHVTSLQTSLDGLAATVSTLATSTSVSALGTRVTNVETVLDAAGNLTQAVSTVNYLTDDALTHTQTLADLLAYLSGLRDDMVSQAASATETLSAHILDNGDTIAKLQLDLAAATAQAAASVSQTFQAMTLADSAEALARLALAAALTDTNSNVTTNASAISTLSGTVSMLSGTVTSQGSAITALQNTVNNGTTGVGALNTALSSLTSTVSSQGSTITSQGSAITALQSTVNNGTTGVAALNTALASLTSTVTSQGATISSQGTSITSLTSGLSTANGNISTLSTGLSAANSNISSNTSAINSLNTLTTSQGSTITSQGSAITALQSLTGDPTHGNSALATAVSGINTSVTSINGTLSSQASSITTLTAGVAQATASGTVGFYAVSAPSGYSAAYQIKIMVSGTPVYAGIMLLVTSGGVCSITFDAQQFTFRDTTNGLSPTTVFAIAAGVATFNIPVSIRTQDIAPGAVSQVATAIGSSGVNNVSKTVTTKGGNILVFAFDPEGNGGTTATLTLKIDGTTKSQALGGSYNNPGPVVLPISLNYATDPASPLSAGSHTFALSTNSGSISASMTLIIMELTR